MQSAILSDNHPAVHRGKVKTAKLAKKLVDIKATYCTDLSIDDLHPLTFFLEI